MQLASTTADGQRLAAFVAALFISFAPVRRISPGWPQRKRRSAPKPLAPPERLE
jgi:hypothetical protein